MEFETIRNMEFPMDYCMCVSKQCPDAKRCRRHAASGTIPHAIHQSMADFSEFSKDGIPITCSAYWPHPHKHLDEK